MMPSEISQFWSNATIQASFLSLCSFLDPVLTAKSEANGVDWPRSLTLEKLIVAIPKFFVVRCVPLFGESTILALATTPSLAELDGTLIMLRQRPSIIARGRFVALDLCTGKNLELSADMVRRAKPLYVLVDDFSDLEPTKLVSKLLERIYKPLMSWQRELIVLQAIASLIGALWFSVNFILLHLYIADGGHEAVFVFMSLVASVIIGAWALTYIRQRSQVVFDAAVDKRISVFWFAMLLRSTAVGDAMTRERLSALVKAHHQQKAIATVLIAGFFPVLFFSFLRLPFVMLAFFSLLIATMILLRNRTLKLAHSGRLEAGNLERDVVRRLEKMLSAIKKLKQNKSVEAYARQLRDYAVDREKARFEEKRLVKKAELISDLSVEISMAAGILSLTVLQAVNQRNGSPELTIAVAYSIIYLTTNYCRVLMNLSSVLIEQKLVRDDLSQMISTGDNLMPVEHMSTNYQRVETNVTYLDLVNVELPFGCSLQLHNCVGSIRVKRGDFIYLSGESGSGKSTFIDSVLGLRTEYGGKISIMGVAPAQLTDYDRFKIFTALDGVPLKGMRSIRETLAFFDPDKVMKEADLWRNLEFAGLAERVRNLKLKLDCPLLDAHTFLSTGEKQRLLLAQALAKPGKIFIADEAFSGLAEELELALLDDVRRRYDIVIVASHRQHLRNIATHVFEFQKVV